MSKIETGVDKLVELVNKEKKISVDDAAKKLGISKVVIQEWADFLEEEKIISVEYSLSKAFLVERKLTQEEVKTKQKEYNSEKDAFVRKVEGSLKSLEKEAVGFEKIRSEFEVLKKGLGGEIDKVKGQVKELEKFEYLKKNLDNEIEKQIADFHAILDKSHKDVDVQHKRHQELLEAIEVEKRELQVKEHRLMSLEEKEKELMQRLQELLEISKELQKKSLEERSSIQVSEDRVLGLERAVREIEHNVLKKKTSIQPLLDKSKKHEEDILRLQQDILEKAKNRSSEIKAKVDEGTKVLGNFEAFFQKKDEVEGLIKEIEEELKGLEDGFKDLKRKALAFDLVSKSNTVNTHVKAMEQELKDITAKKTKFREDLEKLIKLVKG